MRRLFILECIEGKWFLTCNDTAFVARVAMKLPRWLFRVESARLGYDIDNFVKISRQ